MKKLYHKDAIWFAVAWIGLYVAGFSGADMLSEKLGVPKLVTCAVGLVMAAYLLRFVKSNGLMDCCGLICPKGAGKRTLFYIPLMIISGVNLWNGLAIQATIPEIIAHVVSMAMAAFLEELIFRGFLFQGMRKNMPLWAAAAICALTFGMGHMINLFLGAPLAETLLQLVYAAAVGFCYTAVFIDTGSILPCILSHAAVNCTSIFAVTPEAQGQIVIAAVQTLLSVGYGFWLLRRKK